MLIYGVMLVMLVNSTCLKKIENTMTVLVGFGFVHSKTTIMLVIDEYQQACPNLNKKSISTCCNYYNY